jgi:hypothetical protein
MDVIEIISSVFIKCSKLDINTKDELLGILWALSIHKPKKILVRIFDKNIDQDDFIDFISNIKMFDLDSKGDIRRLVKDNGIKVNNQIPPQKISDIKWLSVDNIDFAIIKKGKNDFDFIFK